MPRKAQKVNIFSIAKEAGVSPATVSRVANRNPGVKEPLRQRVEELLKKYSFKPNSSSARKSNIAIIFPDTIFGSYATAAISGIYRYAAREGCMASLIAESVDFAAEVRERQCSGVICLLPDIVPASALEELRALGLPLTLIDSTTEMDGVGFVSHDAYAGAREAMRLLLGLGHRRIAFFQEGPGRKDHMQRFKGYEDALNEAGVKLDPALIVSAPNLESCHAGVKMAERLLMRSPDATAIFAVDDNIAMGAMTAIQRMGLRVPDDISVVGFDNYEFSQHCFPALTTVNHPIIEAVELAAKAVDDAFRYGSWTPPRAILTTKLVRRDSTGLAPKSARKGRSQR